MGVIDVVVFYIGCWWEASTYIHVCSVHLSVVSDLTPRLPHMMTLTNLEATTTKTLAL